MSHVGYKLFERMILNRMNPITDHTIIREQARFRAGTSCTSELVNLDRFAAYDTVNHRLLLTKLYGMTEDAEFPKLIGSMLNKLWFYGKKIRSRNQKNGLPQGSVLSPMLFSVYTNDQLVHNDTCTFIYADDLCIATQRSTFEQRETILTETLPNLGEYYEKNHLRLNLDKTQTCAFHLKNREASRKLNITWYNKHLEHMPDFIYLVVTLDRTLKLQRAHTQNKVQNIRLKQYP